MIIYYFFQINQLKTELNELKAVVAVANDPLNEHRNHASIRSKRQTSRVKESDNGDNLPVFDRAYGVDLNLKVTYHHSKLIVEFLSKFHFLAA